MLPTKVHTEYFFIVSGEVDHENMRKAVSKTV
jgi:hypothetical protein